MSTDPIFALAGGPDDEGPMALVLRALQSQQRRIEALEATAATMQARASVTKTVEHHRDPVTNQIIRSTITEVS